MKYKLSQKDIETIEKSINRQGRSETTVKVENNQLLVMAVEKKKIS